MTQTKLPPENPGRFNQRGAISVVRLVGIIPAYQRQGHGRALAKLIDTLAIASGVTELRVNA